MIQLVFRGAPGAPKFFCNLFALKNDPTCFLWRARARPNFFQSFCTKKILGRARARHGAGRQFQGVPKKKNNTWGEFAVVVHFMYCLFFLPLSIFTKHLTSQKRLAKNSLSKTNRQNGSTKTSCKNSSSKRLTKNGSPKTYCFFFFVFSEKIKFQKFV